MKDRENARERQYWAVVPAAGVGSRMNVDVPKQYLDIAGKTVIEHTLERLIAFPLLEKIVVVLGQGDSYAEDIGLLQHKKIVVTEGGDERYLSVINGLHALDLLAHDDDWVMVHDAVRPCVRSADIEWLVECLRGHEVGGVLGAMVKDTMMRSNADGGVIEIINRVDLWHAHTPQMFKKGMLTRALTKAITDGVSVTDEASAMVHAGHKPLMVQGHSDNIKVTIEAELDLASLYIQQQTIN